MIIEKEFKVTDKFASLGTGRYHADAIMDKGYKYNLSTKAAAALARRALFDATFFDRQSGGPLHVFHVEKATYHELEECDVLDAYNEFYHHYEEEKTLFLVISAHKRAFSANQIIDHFKRTFGEEAKAAHRVADRKSGHNRFYFHRLVFDSKKKASKVYTSVKKSYDFLHNQSTPSFLKEHFPYRLVFFDDVNVYLGKCSKISLQVIMELSEKYIF